MAIAIYNTLTRQKEIFEPQNKEEVSFYVCGPTVYNYIHIGNARSAAAFDTIRRYMMYRGYKVKYVSNFTDVDDKIIKAAREEGLSPETLADKYIQAFKEDTQAINILPATIHPRVMENIQEIITFIERLMANGYAYESDGDVYFKTRAFKAYGKLSDQSLEDLMIGASQRVIDEIAERKNDPLDFALWKKAKEGEIAWPSPWGQGRPGWHIECSVMATRYLGDTIDIHGGGQDLQFPHHENEVAQSECATGHQFANYWMHNGFVTIGQDDEKMSKSLGNFVLLRDLIKEIDPVVVRYLLSTVHYRRPLRFDQAAIQEAQTNVGRLREINRRIGHRMKDATLKTLATDQDWLAQVTQYVLDFEREMDNDFHAQNAVTVLFDLTKIINRYLDQSQVSRGALEKMAETFNSLIAIFGIEMDQESTIDAEIQALIDERDSARKNKDFAKSDAIRDHLKAQGILLDDTPQGTTWKRV